MKGLYLFLKKKLRGIYYMFFNNRNVKLTKPEILFGKKWIVNKNYGRAYFKGYYEPMITKYLINSINENSIFFDVGAHAGYFSLIAASIIKNGKAISFEPMPDNYNYMKKIRHMNKISNWEIYNIAISDKKGESGFLEGETSSTGKIVTRDMGDIIINTLTLDSFIKNNSLYPDIVKIDVEGQGDKVLKGFTLLENYPKKINVLFEIHNKSNELNYIKETFNSDNYRITDLKNNPVDLNSKPSHIIITNN